MMDLEDRQKRSNVNIIVDSEENQSNEQNKY